MFELNVTALHQKSQTFGYLIQASFTGNEMWASPVETIFTEIYVHALSKTLCRI